MSTTPASGPISFDDISHALNKYTSATPPQISMNQMYKDSVTYSYTKFSSIGWNSGLPTSGQISMSQLYNKSMMLVGSWKGGSNSSTNASSYTFNIAIGASTTGNRQIVVVVGGGMVSAGLTISSVTVNGLDCFGTQTSVSAASGIFLGQFITYDDAITTATVVVTLSATATRCGVSVYTIENDQGGYGTTPIVGSWGPSSSRSSFSVTNSSVYNTPGFTIYSYIGTSTGNPTWALPDGSTMLGGDYAVNLEAAYDFTTLGLHNQALSPASAVLIPASITLSTAAGSGIVIVQHYSA